MHVNLQHCNNRPCMICEICFGVACDFAYLLYSFMSELNSEILVHVNLHWLVVVNVCL